MSWESFSWRNDTTNLTETSTGRSESEFRWEDDAETNTQTETEHEFSTGDTKTMVDGQSEPLYTYFHENKHDSKLVQTHPGGALRQVYDLTSSGGFKFTWLHGSPHGVLEDISTSSLAEHWDVTQSGATTTIHAFTYAAEGSTKTDYGTLQYESSYESTGSPDGTVTTTSKTQWSGSKAETNPPTTVQYITGLAAHKDDFVNPLIQFQYPTGFVEALLTEIGNAAALVSEVYSTLAELPPVQAALSTTFFDELLGIGFNVAAAPINYTIDTYNNLRDSGYTALGAGMVTAFDMLGHVVGSDNLANLIEGRNAAGAKLSGFQLSIDAGLLGIKVFTAGISGAAVVHAGRASIATSGGLLHNATGFLGRRGFEFANHPGQPVRNIATQIGERTFSGHALDQMQNRGLIPSVVENTIKVGRPQPGRGGATVYYDVVNNVTVIVNKVGDVITTFFGGL